MAPNPNPTKPASLPPGSIAAMVRALEGDAEREALANDGADKLTLFRMAACALLRLSRGSTRAECEGLALVFAEDISDDGRRLVLELLASAGSPEAQALMRRLLSLPIARRDSRAFATFLQRLGLLERPDGSTVRFLMSVYAESAREVDDVRAGCAYALGIVAGKAHRWGLVDSTVRASEILRCDLVAAEARAHKCSLLVALGNAGLERDIPLILHFFGDADANVRAAAIAALRSLQAANGDSAPAPPLATDLRNSLVSIVGTKSPMLGACALATLAGHALPEEDIVRLAELVMAGRIAPELDSALLRLIVTQKLVVTTTPDVVKEAIQFLLRRMQRVVERRVSGEAPKASESAAFAKSAARTVMQGGAAVPPALARTVMQGSSGPERPRSEVRSSGIVPAPGAADGTQPSRPPPRLDATIVDPTPFGAIAARTAVSGPLRSKSAFSICVPVQPLAVRGKKS